MKMLNHNRLGITVFSRAVVLLLNAFYGLCSDYGDDTELIQQKAGYDVKLQCDLKGLIEHETLTIVKIHWFFKQCNDDPTGNELSCQQLQEKEWIQLPCGENFCKPELILRNVTEQYSGLYRCIISPYRVGDLTTADIQFTRTFQLDVKNGQPEFLFKLPSNKTTTVGQQVILQCRVSSQIRPTIKWFRRLPEVRPGMKMATALHQNNNLRIFKYNGLMYELLYAAREKFISDDTYLSKLIWNDVRLQDEGFYACVPITYRGFGVRETYLKVYEENESEYIGIQYRNSEESQTDPKEFWLLFLMPLGLAMLPLSVWLCYLISKRLKTGNKTDRARSEVDQCCG